MQKESDIWKKLKEVLPKSIRIENSTGVQGVPDVFFIHEDTHRSNKSKRCVSGWIELKYVRLKDTPKKLSTTVKNSVNLRAPQAYFLTKYKLPHDHTYYPCITVVLIYFEKYNKYLLCNFDDFHTLLDVTYQQIDDVMSGKVRDKQMIPLKDLKNLIEVLTGE